MNGNKLAVLIVLALVVVSCRGRAAEGITPTAPPPPTATSRPIATPTPKPTDTPVPTDTPAPTATLVPTVGAGPTDTPTPTATPRSTDTPVPSQPTSVAVDVSGLTEELAALVQALVEGDEQARRAAAEQLVAMGSGAAAAIPALIQALSSQDQSVREIVADVLGLFGPQAAQAIPSLIEALQDRSEAVRVTAAEALKAITGQDFGLDAASWRQWWDQQQAAAQDDTGGGPLDFPAPDHLDHWEPVDDAYRVTIIVHISGGVAPFMVRHDLETYLTSERDYPLVFTVQGCTMIHTIAVESSDGQSVSHDYYIEAPWCN